MNISGHDTQFMTHKAQEQGKTHAQQHAQQTQLEHCVSLHVAAPNPNLRFKGYTGLLHHLPL